MEDAAPIQMVCSPLGLLSEKTNWVRLSWLSAPLDYLPGIKLLRVQMSQTSQDMLPEDVVQREMVKITTIKAKITQSLADHRHAEDHEVRALREELQAFHGRLPGWMTLDQLLMAARNEPLRKIISYVHLFYLSTMMLLHRRLILKLVSVDEPPPIVGRKDSEQIRLGIADGLLAAKTAARVFNLMLADGIAIKICWLCMYVRLYGLWIRHSC